jgi:heptosyltransferase-3
MMVPDRVLVVIPRRIGDVLLATPLMRSLKRAWPQAQIDALVFRGTEGVLTANPDLTQVLTIAERPGFAEHLRLYATITRRYDLAVSLLTGDRPTLYALAAGRRSVGLQMTDPDAAWKRRRLDQWVAFDNLDTHTVRMNLALAEALGIQSHAEIVVSWSAHDQATVNETLPDWNTRPFAVLHAFPTFNYKKWTLAGWVELARWLEVRGLRVFLSGGLDPEEIAYVSELAQHLPNATALAGKFSLSPLGYLLSKAQFYCGPDTAVTHMSAALGVPTVALFGPSNPVKWGPWPRGYSVAHNPWQRVGSQRQGNVFLIQGEAPCAPGVPCLLEGCERHVASYSECLQQLPAQRVIRAAEDLLSPAIV